MADDEDDALLRRMRALSSSSLPVPSSVAAVDDADEAEQLLLEAEAELNVFPEAPATAVFPEAPSHEVAAPEALPVAAAVRAQADTVWCHICRADAHVWCSGCNDEAFCAACWRETHAQSWAPAELRLHRTVPCREVRLAAKLPEVPPGGAGLRAVRSLSNCNNGGSSSKGGSGGTSRPPGAQQQQQQQTQTQRPPASTAAANGILRVPPCHGCAKPAAVWCSGCEDTAYCQKCWREIHSLLPELRKHQVVRVQSTVNGR